MIGSDGRGTLSKLFNQPPDSGKAFTCLNMCAKMFWKSNEFFIATHLIVPVKSETFHSKAKNVENLSLKKDLFGLPSKTH